MGWLMAVALFSAREGVRFGASNGKMAPTGSLPATGKLRSWQVCWALAVAIAPGAGVSLAQAEERITDLDRLTVTGHQFVSRRGGMAGWLLHANGGGGIVNPYIHTEPDQVEDLPDPSAADCENQAGNPVVISTGNKIEHELDFASEGEVGLYLQRTYNSHTRRAAMGKLFGGAWTSNLDLQLGTDASGGCYAVPGAPACSIFRTEVYDIHVRRPDGSDLTFTYDTRDAKWYSRRKPGSVPRLEFNYAESIWTLYTEDRTVERYTAGGFIKEIKNEHGIGWTFVYGGANGTQLQKVTHTSGRSMQLVWTGNVITAVTDPAGNTYTYAYGQTPGGTHRLESVIHPDGATVTYHYEGTSTAFTGKSYDGVRYSISGRQADGLQFTEHAGGVERYTFKRRTLYLSYVPAPDGNSVIKRSRTETDVTNPLGKKTTYLFVDDKMTDVTGHPSANCPSSFRTHTYDARGFPDQKTDNEGNTTDYDYDVQGRLLKTVEAYGTTQARTTTYTWDEAKNRMTGVSIAGDSETSFSYAADGRIRAVSVKNLSSQGVANQIRTTNYTYTKHANGMLATMVIDGPLPNDTVTETYSQTGDLLIVRNGLGHTITYSNYNALGLPGRVTGSNGAVTEYTYDARGRIAAARAIVNGVAQTTRYTYDGAGWLLTITTPDNVTLTRDYDAAGRLMREYKNEADGTFAVKLYTYNNASQVASVKAQRAAAVDPFPPLAAPTVTTPATNNTGGFTVTWNSVGASTRYELQQRKDGGSWSKIHDAAGTSKAVSGLTTGSYGYRVRACNAGGCSGYSAIKTTVVTRPPSAPSVTAPATNSTGGFTMSWASVSAATRYELQQRKDGGSWSKIHDAAGTSKAVSGLSSGSYDYRARACNDSGCSSYSAIRTTVVTLPPTAAPTVTAPATNNTGGFTVSWTTVSATTRYELQQRKDGGSWSKIHDATGTSKVVSGLTAGNYDYRARACNAGGCAAYSAIKTTVVTFPPATAPTLTAPATSSNGTFTVSWTSVTGASKYRLWQRKDASGLEDPRQLVYDGTALSKAMSGLTNGSYEYSVDACNAGGCKSSAVKVTVVTYPALSAPTLSAPNGLINSYGGGSYIVSWSTISGATRYELEQSFGGSWLNAYNGSGTSKSFTVTSGSSGSASYRVRACNASSCGPYSAARAVWWENMGGCDPNTGICEDPRSVDPTPEEM